MIVFDRASIKNCEFGTCVVVNHGMPPKKMRYFKTIVDYVVIFPFGSIKEGYNCPYNISQLRDLMRQSENLEIISFNDL